MITFSLQSGSNGNAIYVEAEGVRLMFDAGISAKQAKLRMQQRGRSMQGLDGLILSHDHSDHVRHAGSYARLFRLPVYCTRRTHTAVQYQLGPVEDLSYFQAGETLSFGEGRVRVRTIPTPHDAVDGVCFVVECAAGKLGIFLDLGHPFLLLHSALRSVDACYIESNYDPQMLEAGPYSPELKERIRGERGHISNIEAAELLAGCGKRLRWAALAHLSAENNAPEVALRTHRERLGEDYPLLIATRHSPTEILSLE
ncbi:MAG: MBL fold metallo-hydrolase [Phycisphaerae bacterium]|nr:MBL fold metallo-hydrolase [Phycisphaerae bacterium]